MLASQKRRSGSTTVMLSHPKRRRRPKPTICYDGRASFRGVVRLLYSLYCGFYIVCFSFLLHDLMDLIL
ncbi:hypothetical protein BDW69DRAFT_158575 [Aspergillus filifer]